MLRQSRAFFQFARGALRVTKGRKYDLVFATSSRLMTAALGALIAQRSQSTLYLDIRDIFVETIGDILPRIIASPVRVLFSMLERWTFDRADHINFVSEGFKEYIGERVDHASLTWFTNGIDEEFVTSPQHKDMASRCDRRLTILYAGNIGEGQGLHNVLPRLALALQDRADFVVIGDGGRRAALESALISEGIRNVKICPPRTRNCLVEAYRAADVLFLHLGTHHAFERVLPSKIFEYGAVGKPILAGVSGYAAKFIQQEVRNSAVFSPGDVPGALRALETLNLCDTSRDEFVSKYRRKTIAIKMAVDVLAVADCRLACQRRPDLRVDRAA